MKNIITSILVLVAIFSYSQGRYEVELASFNSEVSDFGPSYIKDGLIFASERDSLTLTNRRHRINGKLRPFLQLFSVKEGDSSVDRLRTIINKKYHESTVAITKDGNTMYFTRNNSNLSGSLRFNKNRVALLKLFVSKKNNDGEWGEAVPVRFNNDEYSVAHPALSPDEKWLYFASDMPGTIGNSDIYKVSISENGELGVPENLGEKINTISSDTFPFISSTGDIYFASNREGGYGGLDLYIAHQEVNFNTVDNLGESLNSISDDFALIFNDNLRTGYFSSNREGGMGDDDIYSFTEKEPFVMICNSVISGVVTDDKTGEILANVLLKFKNSNNEEFSIESNEKGEYKLELNCTTAYSITAKKIDYEEKNESITTLQNDNIEKNISLKYNDEPPYEIGTDLAYKLDLIPINFDSNKWNIRPDAAVKLDRVVKYMQQFPTSKIAINSHTDARGSDSYNLKLSDRRASSTLNYIAKQGNINKDRITAKGFGEKQLINKKCSNGNPCTDEEHLINRRSEFIVISK